MFVQISNFLSKPLKQMTKYVVLYTEHMVLHDYTHGCKQPYAWLLKSFGLVAHGASFQPIYLATNLQIIELS